ncbi:hypothetical protein PPERSA_02134 [Pseudocohnilembus persalinus]|uniref:Uncharacterized protein n=1 Tax=Pseudocohnilembus persalinus TaxID=266149 RepID=A0A0V0Q7G3_PSEPJ|nr:hypothetical protein PPERSA_02134 [Pseudocohnilembus persalinus]|eukprot:KRW98156.1 hypothetical protein PPERSA_02134 [Pseudocohnilembus persalinus]
MSQIFKNQLKQIVNQEKGGNGASQSVQKTSKLYKQTNKELRASGKDIKLGKMQSDKIFQDNLENQKRNRSDVQPQKVLSLKSKNNEIGKVVQESIVNKFKETQHKKNQDKYQKNYDQVAPQVYQKQLFKKSEKEDNYHISENSYKHQSEKSQNQSKKHQNNLIKEDRKKQQHHKSRHYHENSQVRNNSESEDQKYQNQFQDNESRNSRSRSGSFERYQKKQKTTQKSHVQKDLMQNINNNNNQVRRLEIKKNQNMSNQYQNNGQYDRQLEIQQKQQKVIDLYDNPYASLQQQPQEYDEKGFKILMPHRIQKTILLEKSENKKDYEESRYTGRVLQLQKY